MQKKTECKVIEHIKSSESGLAWKRPDLLKALKVAAKSGACLLVSKVDRLARNLVAFLAVTELPIRIVFADHPHIYTPNMTVAERSALYRAAMESHLEALKIGERTAVALARKQKQGVKMGGRAHSEGSKALRKRAVNEAKRVKGDIGQIVKSNPNCGPRRIAINLNEKNILTDQGLPFKWQRVKSRMIHNGQWKYPVMKRRRAKKKQENQKVGCQFVVGTFT